MKCLVSEDSNLARFRNQLWLEHIEVYEETANQDYIIFVLAEDSLPCWSIENLLRICKFSIAMLYCDGNKHLCLLLKK